MRPMLRAGCWHYTTTAVVNNSVFFYETTPELSLRAKQNALSLFNYNIGTLSTIDKLYYYNLITN